MMARSDAAQVPSLQEKVKLQQEEEEWYTEHLVEQWKKPNTLIERDCDGYTKLHLALLHGLEGLSCKIMREMENPDYLDAENRYRQTALHIAAARKETNMVRRLVIAGALVHLRDQLGNTPMHFACRFGALDCVRALIEPVTLGEQKQWWGYPIISRRSWVDLTWVNYDGDSCLRLAGLSHLSPFKHPQGLAIVEVLAQYGGNINECHGKNGKTLLHLAVEHDDILMVKLLLSLRGISVNISDFSGYTPVTIASARGNRAMVAYLILQGADPCAGKPWSLVVKEDEREIWGSSEEEGSEGGLMITEKEIKQLTINTIL